MPGQRWPVFLFYYGLPERMCSILSLIYIKYQLTEKGTANLNGLFDLSMPGQRWPVFLFYYGLPERMCGILSLIYIYYQLTEKGTANLNGLINASNFSPSSLTILNIPCITPNSVIKGQKLV